MEYFEGKIELDSEFSEERREEFRNFLDFLFKQDKSIIPKTPDLLVKVNRSGDLKCEGHFSDPGWMEHNEDFDYEVFATFPEYEGDSVEDYLKILAHEYRHFVQEVNGVSAHEGDAEIWADEMVKKFETEV